MPFIPQPARGKFLTDNKWNLTPPTTGAELSFLLYHLFATTDSKDFLAKGIGMRVESFFAAHEVVNYPVYESMVGSLFLCSLIVSENHPSHPNRDFFVKTTADVVYQYCSEKILPYEEKKKEENGDIC